jgi:hypothetical protein
MRSAIHTIRYIYGDTTGKALRLKHLHHKYVFGSLKAIKKGFLVVCALGLFSRPHQSGTDAEKAGSPTRGIRYRCGESLPSEKGSCLSHASGRPPRYIYGERISGAPGNDACADAEERAVWPLGAVEVSEDPRCQRSLSGTYTEKCNRYMRYMGGEKSPSFPVQRWQSCTCS